MAETVSIVKCQNYDSENVYQKIKEGMDLLGGMGAFVGNGERVLLKPNFLVGRAPEKCVNTHPEVVRAVARLVLEAGARPMIGDGPQRGLASKVAEKCGVADVARELGIEIVEFEPVEVQHPEGKHFKQFVVGKVVLEADKIINLPKLKTHTLTCMTLAVKNLFGCIPGMKKAQWHVRTSQSGTEYFAKVLVDLYSLIRPALSIVDGVVSMEGKGPGFGDPRELGLIFSGTDALSVDAVIAGVLELRPEDFPTQKAALDDGYESGRLENIDVRGQGIEQVRVSDFVFPQKRTEITGFMKTFMGFLKGQLTTHPFIVHEKCKECNSCVEACPLKCIAEQEGGLMIETKKCIQCFCCMEVCPEAAVDLKDGSLTRVVNLFRK